MKYFKVRYCYNCLKPVEYTEKYRVDLILKSGALSGIRAKRIYLCRQCLEKLTPHLAKHYKVKKRLLRPKTFKYINIF